MYLVRVECLKGMTFKEKHKDRPVWKDEGCYPVLKDQSMMMNVFDWRVVTRAGCVQVVSVAND